MRELSRRRGRTRGALLLVLGALLGFSWPRLQARFFSAAPEQEEVEDEAADDQAYADGEDLVYAQSSLIQRQDDALKPQRPGVVDLYFVGFAGQATEDVFMREVAFARGLFDRRFDTAGRSAVLINNRATKDRFPLASLASLQRTLEDVGEILDPEEDVLFLFLTSHGSENHELSVDYYPLPFVGIAPEDLAHVLDDSKIGWRVVVISACYSGAFVDALENDHTLVITASAADRQSFGCGTDAELTYFGKAFLQDGLEKQRSFLGAFESAAASIAKRERKEKLEASAPKIHAPEPILGKLRELEERLRAVGGDVSHLFHLSRTELRIH